MSNVPTQVSDRVLQMLSSGARDLEQARPNNGQGSQADWPPAGNYDARVTAIEVKMDEFRFHLGDKAKDKTVPGIPVVKVIFHYETLPNEKAPDFDPNKPKVWSFQGKPLELMPGYEKLLSEEKQRNMASMNWGRFKGHAAVLLGRDPNQLVDPGQTIRDLVTEVEKQPIVELKVDAYDQTKQAAPGAPGGPKVITYKTDFLVSRLDVA